MDDLRGRNDKERVYISWAMDCNL